MIDLVTMERKRNWEPESRSEYLLHRSLLIDCRAREAETETGRNQK